MSIATAAPKLVRIGRVPEREGPGPHAIAVGGVDLVLLRTAAGPRVFQGRCPHQGALLGEGELEGDRLVCRNHRWRFDVETGARDGGPECLIACPAVERDGDLYVDLSPLDGASPLPSARRRRISDAETARTVLRRPCDLPGPRGLPLLGNALQIDIDRLHLIFEGWAREYGSVFTFRLGRQRSVVISDRDLSEQILRSRPDTYRRVTKVQTVFKELAVDGVFSAEGAAWRAQRRLSMEALSQRHLRGFYPTLKTVTTRLLQRWEAAADARQPTDMVQDLKRFTVDITTMLTFGHDLNTIQQTGDDVVQRRLELLFPAFTRRIFALWPYWRFIRLPGDRRLDRVMAELREWMDGLVRKARARLEVEPGLAAHPSNFLEAMLSARDESGEAFSDETIFANLMTMLLAGEDTTAATLAWAVHEMCESPASIDALRVELDDVLAGDRVPVDMETAGRLAYTAAVANETMRLRPVAPVLYFETLVDTTLGDLDLRAGTPVGVLTRIPALDSSRFRDPDTFRPRRWTVPEEPHDPSAHIPFGSGPRICPGRSLALLEMRVVLAMLYQNFEVTREGAAAEVREQYAFTMGPSRLSVRLARRATSSPRERR